MERIVAMKSKKARTALKEGLQAGIKRPAANSPRDSSSEDEEGIVRPCRDMVMPMCKHDFLEKMKLLNHPILQNEEKLEMTYRYIDLANSMLKSPEKKMEEIQIRQDSQDSASRQATGKNEETAFFKGNNHHGKWSGPDSDGQKSRRVEPSTHGCLLGGESDSQGLLGG